MMSLFGHLSYMQPHYFLDELVQQQNDHGNGVKQLELELERQRKSQYVIRDLETHALNEVIGRGRLVPYLSVAMTTCFNCMDRDMRMRMLCSGGTLENRSKVHETKAFSIDMEPKVVRKNLNLQKQWGYRKDLSLVQ